MQKLFATLMCAAGSALAGTLNADKVAAVPEPATLGLLGAGLFGIAALRRRGCRVKA